MLSYGDGKVAFHTAVGADTLSARGRTMFAPTQLNTAPSVRGLSAKLTEGETMPLASAKDLGSLPHRLRRSPLTEGVFSFFRSFHFSTFYRNGTILLKWDRHG